MVARAYQAFTCSNSTIGPTKHLHVQIQQKKHQKKARNKFKVMR